jgi:competence protein ComEC
LRLASWVGAALAISLVASLATAPVAAAEFGRVSQYSLLANLLAGPLQEFIVAPAAVFAALMSPLGWDGPFWAIARWGLALVMDIGAWVAGLPGAGGQIIWTGALAPALMCWGVLWLCLWRSRLRALAALPAILGVMLWWSGPQPVGWIAPGGVAVLGSTPSTGPRLCREPGPSGGGSGAARFDAARLLDEARITPAVAERLLRTSGKPPADHAVGCRVTGPGWESQWSVNADGTDPHLLVMIEGDFHRVRPRDLPQGALILKHGDRVWLEAPPLGPGPWAGNRNSPG